MAKSRQEYAAKQLEEFSVVRVRKHLALELKIACAKNGQTMLFVVNKLVEDYLKEKR